MCTAHICFYLCGLRARCVWFWPQKSTHWQIHVRSKLHHKIFMIYQIHQYLVSGYAGVMVTSKVETKVPLWCPPSNHIGVTPYKGSSAWSWSTLSTVAFWGTSSFSESPTYCLLMHHASTKWCKGLIDYNTEWWNISKHNLNRWVSHKDQKRATPTIWLFPLSSPRTAIFFGYLLVVTATQKRFYVFFFIFV